MKETERNEWERKVFHAAIDDTLSGLQGDPWLFRRVISETQKKGSEKMIKKMSVGLVLTILLILLTMGTAVALMTMREVGQEIAAFEQEDGAFTDWPAERKAIVVTHLMEQGYIPETEVLRKMADGKLTEEEISRIADDAVAALLGRDAVEGGFLTIMQAVWGPFDSWSHEDRAWYSQVTENVGIDNSDKTVYRVPEGGMTEAAARNIARKDIANAYDIDESVLDRYDCIVNFQVPEFAEHDENAKTYWYVAFDTAETWPDMPFRAIELFIDPDTGKPTQSASEIRRERDPDAWPDTDLYRLVRRYTEEAGTDFPYWTLEQKAAWSDEVTLRVQAIVETGDLSPLINCGSVDDALLAACTFTYSLPDENALSQVDALNLAQKALIAAYSLPEDHFAKFSRVAVSYDVTDEGMPRWKFCFDANDLMIDQLEGGFDSPLVDQCFRAEVNAGTGEILQTEQFALSYLGKTMEYRLKWY